MVVKREGDLNFLSFMMVVFCCFGAGNFNCQANTQWQTLFAQGAGASKAKFMCQPVANGKREPIMLQRPCLQRR